MPPRLLPGFHPSGPDRLRAGRAAQGRLDLRRRHVHRPRQLEPPGESPAPRHRRPREGPGFGSVAGKALGELIEDKVVEVQQIDKDRYGRVVANVHVGGVHVNREQVAKGLAWRYVQYDKKGEFTQVEQAARAARKGLWADAHPVPPWEWRKSEKERKAAKKGAGVGR